MIVKFSPALFNTEDVHSLLDLMAIFTSYVRNTSFYWDAGNIEDLFTDDEGEFTFKNYLGLSMFGPEFRKIFEEKVLNAYKSSAYETRIHKKYLSGVTVGNGVGEIKVSDAFRLFTTPSVLIVENGTYDGQFLRNIVSSYANFGPRKSIYALIKQAIDKKDLVPSNAGGASGIVNTINLLNMSGYDGILTAKSFTFFDSDRRNNSDINLNHRSLLKVLKGREFEPQDASEWRYLPKDAYFWHMSFKREMENYGAATAVLGMIQGVSESIQGRILSMTPEELDFFDYETVLGKDYKSEVPNIFSHSSAFADVERRCRHHPISIESPTGILESVSEIEYMLLMIAKII